MSKVLLHPPPPTRRPGRGLRTLVRIVFVLLAVGVAGFYLARWQFGELYATKLSERLAEDGVFIGWKSAQWLPGTGVRLNALAVYRDSAKSDRLALFGIVTVKRGDASWSRWDKVSFNAGNTQLLLGSGADETRLDRMELVLILEPGRTDLREFHASLQGLRIQLTCSFVDPAPTGTPEAVAPSKQVTKGLFHDVNLEWLKPVKEWLKFQPEKDEPLLKVELHSLADDKGMGLTMNFDGSEFQWRGQKWDFVQAGVKFPFGIENSPIEIEHVRIGHGGRRAEMSASLDPATRVIHVRKFESAIDALALARALMPDAVRNLSAASTTGEWSISGTGEIPLDHPENFRWKGDASLEGELVYASPEANIALLRPAFSLLVQDQVATISNVKAGLWEGSLNVESMQIHLPSDDKKLQFEGKLALNGAQAQAIVHSFSGKQNQAEIFPLEWKGNWQFSGTAEVPLDQLEKFQWNGDVALDGEVIYTTAESNVALQKPTFSVRMDQQTISITNAKAGLWEGNIDMPKLEVHLPSKEKRLRLETQLAVEGLNSQSIIKSFGGNQKQPDRAPVNWNGAWRIKGTAEIPMDDPENFRWTGDVALDGEFVYASGEANIALQKPSCSVRVEESVASISNFKAGLWDGNLTASRMKVRLPAKDKKLRIETELILNGARSQLVRRSFSARQKQPRSVALNWKGAWRISGTGEVPVDHPGDFRWNGDVALGGDLFYASGETNVAWQKPTFSVRWDEQVVSLSNFKAGLWDGRLEAPRTLIYLPSARKKSRFETQVTLEGAQMSSISGSFGSPSKEPGVVQCDWKGGGEFDLASIAGSGSLSIGEAEFGRMPIIGPLHLIFDKLTPRFRKDEPSTMTVNHRIAGNTLYLDDLKVSSEQVKIEAGGTIDLAREQAQLKATGRLRKIPGLVTVLLTSLLEFKGEGPIDNVHWSLGSVPGFHLLGKAAKKMSRQETEAQKQTGRTVRGVIELPGKVLQDE